MKGWIVFTAVASEDELKVKASSISGVYPHYSEQKFVDRHQPSKDKINILVDGQFLTVRATEEEVFEAIELATQV